MIEQVMFGDVLQTADFPDVGFPELAGWLSVMRGRTAIAPTSRGSCCFMGWKTCSRCRRKLVLTDESMRAYGEFRLRQTDYGLSIASVAGGMLRIKDELKFVYFIVARKQNGA